MSAEWVVARLWIIRPVLRNWFLVIELNLYSVRFISWNRVWLSVATAYAISALQICTAVGVIRLRSSRRSFAIPL